MTVKESIAECYLAYRVKWISDYIEIPTVEHDMAFQPSAYRYTFHIINVPKMSENYFPASNRPLHATNPSAQST